jgi:hypothetical protein
MTAFLSQEKSSGFADGETFHLTFTTLNGGKPKGFGALSNPANMPNCCTLQ